MVSAPDQVITSKYDTDRSPGFRRGFKVGLTAVAGVVVAGSLAGLLSVLPVKSADAQRQCGIEGIFEVIDENGIIRVRGVTTPAVDQAGIVLYDTPGRYDLADGVERPVSGTFSSRGLRRSIFPSGTITAEVVLNNYGAILKYPDPGIGLCPPALEVVWDNRRHTYVPAVMKGNESNEPVIPVDGIVPERDSLFGFAVTKALLAGILK